MHKNSSFKRFLKCHYLLNLEANIGIGFNKRTVNKIKALIPSKHVNYIIMGNNIEFEFFNYLSEQEEENLFSGKVIETEYLLAAQVQLFVKPC